MIITNGSQAIRVTIKANEIKAFNENIVGNIIKTPIYIY
jgi:hypothetical protein